jgi:hypothetical protein
VWEEFDVDPDVIHVYSGTGPSPFAAFDKAKLVALAERLDPKRFGRQKGVARKLIPPIESVSKRLLAAIAKLHAFELDVLHVNNTRDQRALVLDFLIENSPILSDVPMCRTFRYSSTRKGLPPIASLKPG